MADRPPSTENPVEAKPNRRQPRVQVASEWEERVVSLRRAAKVTRGGKRFRFNAMVIVGDRNGRVGLGFGKANELSDAIRKAKDKAIRAARPICLKGSTIPYEVLGKFKACRILMKPATKGTGVIAGGAVRPVLELVGVHDILTKSLRSPNPVNLVKAALEGLYSLRDAREIAERRNQSIAQLFSIE